MMRCPFCNSSETQVKDSRVADDGSYIKRRRFCTECGSRFTTFERIQLKELFVKKANESVVPFDRDKLGRSIAIACRKRPITPERIDKIVTAIQRQLESTGEQEVSSREIGILAMQMLESIDVVAYIRFASVYYKFETRDDFLKFIEMAKDTPAITEDEDAGGANASEYTECKLQG
ncbi:MAG: transcriptional regulator NrdR [Rickettsiales bacterium]|jgi:transcriptional repressor NrdR|nr:transcriptional regulator NrdR [Rickettsiales bacterium]